MAIRIGQYVIGGFVCNSHRNSVHGWLAFDEERGVRFELLGDATGELEGRKIEFHVPDADRADAETIERVLADLQFAQIGAAGEFSVRNVKIPAGPIDELMARSQMGEPPPVDDAICLYLEWFGQDGRVVAEIVNPVMKDLDDDHSETETTPQPELIDTDSNEEALEAIDFRTWEDDDDDPYELFPTDLEQQLGESSGDQKFEDSQADSTPPRDWDEIIPGIDPETKAMYDQWDEIYGGQKDELISTLFDPPIQLPPPDAVNDEQVAREHVMRIVARLATLSIAIDLCKHFTMIRTYRWLIEEVLVEGHVHPQLKPTGIVIHYSSCEYCEACDAEFEAEYQQRDNKD